MPALFLSCQRQEGLPGCLFQFDNPDSQCASGRHGKKCDRASVLVEDTVRSVIEPVC